MKQARIQAILLLLAGIPLLKAVLLLFIICSHKFVKLLSSVSSRPI